MEPIFIYYNNLSFDENKRFTLEFRCYLKTKTKKSKDYYIRSMSSYDGLAVDVTKLSQFDKIKEISDLANAVLVDSVSQIWLCGNTISSSK